MRKSKKCNVKFSDADIKRPLASVSAIVDEGNIVVLGPQDSYTENTSKRLRIPMSRRKWVFVVQLDARTGPRATQHLRLDDLKNERKIQAAKVSKKCRRNSRTV